MKKIILLSLFFVVLSLFYVFTIKGVSGNPKPTDIKNNLDQNVKPLELSPERGRYAQVMSLVLYNRFDLTKTLADAVYPDVGYYKGRFYAYFAPGISIIAAPFYIVGSKYSLAQVATFSSSSIFAVLTGVMIYLVGREILQIPTWASLFAVLIYMFGSTSWSYSVSLYEHSATAFLIISSFYAAWHFKQGKLLSWFMAIYVGLAYAIAILIDYPNALFLAPIMIYFIFSAFGFQNIKDKIYVKFRLFALLSALPFILITGFHLFYNSSNFGAWYRLSGTLTGYKTIVEKKIDTSPGSKQLASLDDKKNPIKFFSQDKFFFGFYTLIFSDDRGLLLYSPIFILALFGLFILIKNKELNPETSTLIAILIMILFLYSSWGDPWGGWAFGPRYLIPAMPILALLVTYYLSKTKIIWMRLVAFLLFMYSAGISLLGVLTTNAIPTKSEGIYLKTGYNFLRNYVFFKDGQSSSFIYTTFLSSKLTLTQYFLIIYTILIVFSYIIIFIIPLFIKEGSYEN